MEVVSSLCSPASSCGYAIQRHRHQSLPTRRRHQVLSAALTLCCSLLASSTQPILPTQGASIPGPLCVLANCRAIRYFVLNGCGKYPQAYVLFWPLFLCEG